MGYSLTAVRRASLLTIAVACASMVVVRAGEQAPAGRPPTAPSVRTSGLPPVVQTCPMHPDIVEDRPGSCPLCRMALVPVRLESVWSCPVHAAVVRNGKGLCPICNRELVAMTMALTWTCRNAPRIDVIEPGRCPDGSPMVPKRTLRPHGNHNPQHGGQFFMAPDNTHHLEGTLPSSRLFRVYLYDDYARPLSAARLKAIRAHIELANRSLPLTASGAGSYLEGRLDRAALPVQLAAKIRLTPDAPEYRFDFAFPAVTKDPSSRVPAATAKPSLPPLPPDADGAVDPALIQVPIPADVPAILAQLRVRDSQVRALLDRGNLAAVFVPAFQARDLALALESRTGDMPTARRDAAGSAIRDLVQSVWLLDAFGDVGNAAQANAAYAPFHDAATRIGTVFGGSR